MADDAIERHQGHNHEGPARTSPYPVSRLAPAHDLVSMAKQIAEADQTIGTVVHAKLEIIAEQIRNLQTQARGILDEAARNATLHRAQCRFRRRVGQTYHLYRRPDGDRYFSLLSPDDWGGPPPHTFEGSYRLEADMSWTPAADEAGPSTMELAAIAGAVPTPRALE